MRFETAAASVTGAAHLRAARNCQDAVSILRTNDALVLVVADGCGSAPHSEVGAKLGAAIVAEELARTRDIEEAAARALSRLEAVASAAAGPREAFILDHLLFTTVAAVIREDETVVVSAGDGVFSINGASSVIGPFEENAPPYLAYALLDGMPGCFTVEHRIATSELTAVAIATDGAAGIATDTLAALHHDELVFRNPDALRRRLFRLTRGAGILDDDTTVALVRRIA
jgi:hypothetical protein